MDVSCAHAFVERPSSATKFDNRESERTLDNLFSGSPPSCRQKTEAVPAEGALSFYPARAGMLTKLTKRFSLKPLAFILLK